MSDLISRSELLKEVKKYKFGAISNDAEREYIKKTILDFIICQPTTYSVDKVVEELKKLQTYNMSLVTLMSDLQKNGVCRHYICLEDAIEIVKQGGLSDDVCEWRLCDEEANVYDTSCKNPHILIEGTPKENNYEFCPYCGKKIKVVE